MSGSEKISDQEFAEWIEGVEGDAKKNSGTTPTTPRLQRGNPSRRRKTTRLLPEKLNARRKGGCCLRGLPFG